MVGANVFLPLRKPVLRAPGQCRYAGIVSLIGIDLFDGPVDLIHAIAKRLRHPSRRR